MNNAKTRLQYLGSTGIGLLASLLAGCSLGKIADQIGAINMVSEITGVISTSSSEKASISVLLFRDGDSEMVLVSKYDLLGEGKFSFYVPPADYIVAAYIDSNGDEEYQDGEHATYYGLNEGEPKRISADSGGKVVLETLNINGPLMNMDPYRISKRLTTTVNNIGRVMSYNDPIFSKENAALGLWRPLSFIERVGPGLYMMQKYQPGKIPVQFVHGINGHVGDFSEIIKHLDTTHFQAFAVYYPSGVRLDMVSSYLIAAINTLQKRYQFTELYVIGHSMGGLVSRSFIKKYHAGKHSAAIKLFMSINSPLMGMDSAMQGVKYSPIVVPVWKDVAFNSEFINDLHKWRLPKEIPYHLVFSFLPGEEGDGVVPMKSQLTRKLQEEAVQIHGFNSQHTELLKQKQFIALFNRILADSLH
jgi:hypothetical protein